MVPAGMTSRVHEFEPHGCSEHLHKHRLPIPRRIEVLELRAEGIPAGLVERPRPLVLRAGRGLHVDPALAAPRDPGFGVVKEHGADSFALEVRMDSDPVEVDGFLGAGDGAPAGVARDAAVHLPDPDVKGAPPPPPPP